MLAVDFGCEMSLIVFVFEVNLFNVALYATITKTVHTLALQQYSSFKILSRIVLDFWHLGTTCFRLTFMYALVNRMWKSLGDRQPNRR